MLTMTNRAADDERQLAGQFRFLANNEELAPREFAGAVVADAKTQHVVLAIHGYNNSSARAESFAQSCRDIFPGESYRVVCLSWPSDGLVTRYTHDREDAQLTGVLAAGVIRKFFEWMQRRGCTTKLHVVAHSMGNLVLAHLAQCLYDGYGQPRSVNVFQEVLMVAADLDSEALEPGWPGSAISKISRRVHVFHSRRDQALAASVAKRFGVTGGRLGRSGAARSDRLDPNVVQVDCTEAYGTNEDDSHSWYFSGTHATIASDFRQVIEGVDRTMITTRTSVDGVLKLKLSSK